MIDIGTKSKEIVKQLREDNEFNGLAIDVTTECEDEWRECYAIFIVDIVDFSVVGGGGSDYMEFHEDDFWKDLQDWVSEHFDDNTVVQIHLNTGEIEIYDEERMSKE